MKTALRVARILRRPLLLALIYSGIFFLSVALSYELRFAFALPSHYARQLLLICLWAIPIKLVALRIFGHFNELLSYFGVPDLRRIIGAIASSSTALLILRVVDGAGALTIPRA